ncbi:hypothetical protein [Methylophilus sp. YYY-1]|uniref:hypothetical protein n=1 Tax=Methylophilus sp. YYY-1 TaxID=2682087 RepID=UPI0023B30D97|nr:hypothetical protein [Methylophilus sp. YYY-1]MDF0377659.1 hypothetical protein [Methylophilus sp. YYY-1]
MLENRKRAIETSPRRRMNSGGLRAKAWWVMRNRKSATLESLLNTLADGSQKDAESNLRKYLNALARAGILKVETRRQPGKALTSNGHHRYSLVIDCGVSAPVWRKSLNQVYCPDTAKVYEIEQATGPMKAVSPKGGTQ